VCIEDDLHKIIHLIQIEAAEVTQVAIGGSFARRLNLTRAMEKMDFFGSYEIIPVDPDENYAVNFIRVNDYVLLAAGYPKLESRLSDLGYQIITIEMSEFQKMDGGLSCPSLRF
jgi:dimethylargininase